MSYLSSNVAKTAKSTVGTLAMTKPSTLNSSRELQLQSSTEFQMPWSWRTRSHKHIFHLIFTTILFQMRMKVPHTTSKYQELVHSRSVTRACSFSLSSRVDTGLTANSSPRSASLSVKMNPKEKMFHNILQETVQWKMEDTVNLLLRKTELVLSLVKHHRRTRIRDKTNQLSINHNSMMKKTWEWTNNHHLLSQLMSKINHLPTWDRPLTLSLLNHNSTKLNQSRRCQIGSDVDVVIYHTTVKRRMLLSVEEKVLLHKRCQTWANMLTSCLTS